MPAIVGFGAMMLTGVMTRTDDLADDLATAQRDGELFAVFQPQISLPDGVIVGAEALCRWRHPQRGLVPPDAFIEAAEQSRLIDEIGIFMIDECFTASIEWRAAGTPISLSVNVSPVQLLTDAFIDYLEAELARRAVAPGDITLEITESAPQVDRLSLIPRLRQVRAMGLGLSLDDFGTGQASMEQLESLPLTEVKLDGTLVRGGTGSSLEPLSEVVAIAHERGLNVVAEGIETIAHLETASAIRCDRAQGYLFGKPLPRDARFSPAIR
jgi:EAL domain-containing protein (putative c-di-GMP-specific phosphodiesterase class I)